MPPEPLRAIPHGGRSLGCGAALAGCPQTGWFDAHVSRLR